MSVINRQPFVDTVLSSLHPELLDMLITAVNGGGTNVFRSFVNNNHGFIGEDEDNVYHMTLETEKETFTGYYVGYSTTNTYVLFAYFGLSQEMKILKLNISNKTYEIINEELNINEFRRCLGNGGQIISGNLADKDMLDDIEISYDEDEGMTKFMFPKNILPLEFCYKTGSGMIQTPNAVFFDFYNGVALDEIGDAYESSEVGVNNEKVFLKIDGALTNPVVDRLSYAFFNNDVIDINTLSLVGLSSGGSIYAHRLYLKYSNSVATYMVLYSTDNTPLTGDDVLAFLYNNNFKTYANGFNCFDVPFGGNADNVTKVLCGIGQRVYATSLTGNIILEYTTVTHNLSDGNVILTVSTGTRYITKTDVTDIVAEL